MNYQTILAEAVPDMPTKNKPGWFKRKLLSWLTDGYDKYPEPNISTKVRQLNSARNISFTIHPADGGHVIEYYQCERFHDSTGPQLLLVPHDANIGDAVSRIIAIEALRT